MRADDPVILRRIQEIEAACAGLRMACGLPDPHAPTSRREGRPGTLDETALANLATFVHREWDEYPDKHVLADELTDRGATLDQARTLITVEQESRQEQPA